MNTRLRNSISSVVVALAVAFLSALPVPAEDAVGANHLESIEGSHVWEVTRELPFQPGGMLPGGIQGNTGAGRVVIRADLDHQRHACRNALFDGEHDLFEKPEAVDVIAAPFIRPVVMVGREELVNEIPMSSM